MCCLFGLLDYKEALNLKQRQRILKVLSIECEERGTDATGIAYFSGNHLTIQKAPKPARRMKYKLSGDARYIMGHTRYATQGDEKLNYNNHPFKGKAGNTQFALAHNGVLYNDEAIRRIHNLPKTQIETDSYIAVQLLEKYGEVSFSTLSKMAEEVHGSFCFTVLDELNNLYIVKGNNPMCIVHFPKFGFYLYASTEEILMRAIKKLGLDKLFFHTVPINQGEILKIDQNGKVERGKFKETFYGFDDWIIGDYSYGTDELDEIREIAEYFGVDSDTMEYLIDCGYGWMEIEEMLYDPELLEMYIGKRRTGIYESITV